ncbi:tetratricopeptide repeat protein [Marinobacter salinisoli]|uniref:Tetratricopeptide repeat protein n=1 Tax=Marinobacter salinisoli TaxID=2769486 RepID=A0ABX7MU14_9GAMM|nr:tetratricopeptide repeat protein [Marinobacter salinisoli]QSP95803.1 tetratricopeptide repeat protein [Marinobacter salinisoli]
MKLIQACLLALLGLSLPFYSASANSPSLSNNSQGYAPVESCGQCHQSQQESWRHSDHAWSMQPANNASVLGDFDDVEFDDGSVQASFFQRGDQYWVNIEGKVGPDDFPIAYTFGHYPLQQYLVELPGGRLQALTIAWDTRPVAEGGQRWFSLYPGQSFAPDDPLHWTGRYQNWNAMCADCHSTFLTMNYQPDTDTFATTWQEQNVGCQGCHGPGQGHVEWANTVASEPAAPHSANDMGLLVDFSAMKPSEVVETCAYCHSRRQPLKDGQHAQEAYLDKALPSTLRPDLYHPDGQIQGEVYVYGSFIQSKMSAAGVTCLDCHDPHSGKRLVEGNGLCLQCHNDAPSERFPQLTQKNYDTPEHHHHPAGSPGAQCVNCHMPEQTYMVVDPRRDHSFRIPRPDLTLSTGAPNACNDCHQEKDALWALEALESWYPDTKHPDHFAAALSAFRQAEQDAFGRLAGLIRDRSVPAIARATAAEHLAGFGQSAVSPLRSGLLAKEPLVRAYAAGAFAQVTPDGNEAILLKLLDSDQPRAVRDQAWRALAGADLSGLSEAEQQQIMAFQKDFESRLASLAALPGSRFNYATYLHQAGRLVEASKQYQQALALDPTFTPARVNLATMASEQGDLPLAAETLKVGADRPEIPDADRGHLAYLLALVLVEQGNIPVALRRFEQASELNPDNPRISYNHALVLGQQKRWQDAENVLASALKQHPDDYGLLQAAVYILIEQGQLEKALGYARRMQSLYPDDNYANGVVRDLEAQLP